ncbi:neuferricin isoform X2 [Oryx dammah]|uniref:neuferricin isoform X2 n=1 Tax=Oryx dammah TaxID=59534 RepID=UPI001A9B116C|nr:neuferricin isoform X2 [Oryx dammah]
MPHCPLSDMRTRESARRAGDVAAGSPPSYLWTRGGNFGGAKRGEDTFGCTLLPRPDAAVMAVCPCEQKPLPFRGRDASRAFVTGDYSEAGLVDDVSDLSFSEMLTLQNWLSFYEKNYKFIGRVIGRFYGEDGLPTPELTQAEAMMTKGLEADRQELIEKQRFPPCNAEWSFIRGSRFWCSQQSGGVSRDWIGVPRKLFKPGVKPHCVCVRTTGPPSDQSPENPTHRNRGDLDNPNLGEYPGCPPLSITCSVPL